MKNISKLLLIALLSLSLFGCQNKDKIAESATRFDADFVQYIDENESRWDDYKDNWFILTCEVDSIKEDYFVASYDGDGVYLLGPWSLGGIKIHLPVDDLKELSTGDIITVIGKITHGWTFKDFYDAFIYDGD